MQKAYAKCFLNYESITDGELDDLFFDFTGSLGSFSDLLPVNLEEIQTKIDLKQKVLLFEENQENQKAQENTSSKSDTRKDTYQIDSISLTRDGQKQVRVSSLCSRSEKNTLFEEMPLDELTRRFQKARFIDFVNVDRCSEASFKMRQVDGGLSCLFLKILVPFEGVLRLSHLDRRLMGAFKDSNGSHGPSTSFVLIKKDEASGSFLKVLFKKEQSQRVSVLLSLSSGQYWLLVQGRWENKKALPFNLSLSSSEKQLPILEKWKVVCQKRMEIAEEKMEWIERATIFEKEKKIEFR